MKKYAVTYTVERDGKAVNDTDGKGEILELDSLDELVTHLRQEYGARDVEIRIHVWRDNWHS